MADVPSKDDAAGAQLSKENSGVDASLSLASGQAEPIQSGVSTMSSAGKRGVDDIEETEQNSSSETQDEDEQAGPPRKKARTSSAAESIIAGDSTNGADEIEDGSESSSKETKAIIAQSEGSSSSVEHVTRAAATGAGTGLRTSFGGSSQILAQNAHPDLLMHSPVTAQERTQLITAIRAGESKQVDPLKKRDLKWAVIPISAAWIVGDTWLEIFESMLDKWCEAFLVRNQKHIEEIGLAPNLLKQAFLRRLEPDVAASLPQTMQSIAKNQLKNPETSRLRNFASEFKPNPKKAAKRAAKKQAQLEKQTEQAGQDQQQHQQDTISPRSNSANTPTDNAEEGRGEDPQSAPQDQQQSTEGEREEGEIESASGEANGVETDIEDARADTPVTQAELDQRHHYFPSIPDDAAFCLTCAQHGHNTTRCPEMTCKHCQGEHFKYECPTRQRCGKCKQLGHKKASCPEKLAVAHGEVVMECAVCGLHDHTEVNCSDVWETYLPQPGMVKKVRSLPTFCYCCGSDTHFGGDCGLADRRIPPTKTWTTATASFYIDPASENEAMVYQQSVPPPPDMSAPVIPGRSIKPQSHIIFESDDSAGEADGAGFLHAPAKSNQQQQRGSTKIQIKSNIKFGNASNGSSLHSQQQGQSSTANAGPGNKSANSGRSTRRQNRGGKDFPLRDVPRATQDDSSSTRKKRKPRQQTQNQQPPLPSGPPPQYRGENSARGRGGFSGLSRRGRARRGQNHN